MDAAEQPQRLGGSGPVPIEIGENAQRVFQPSQPSEADRELLESPLVRRPPRGGDAQVRLGLFVLLDLLERETQVEMQVGILAEDRGFQDPSRDGLEMRRGRDAFVAIARGPPPRCWSDRSGGWIQLVRDGEGALRARGDRRRHLG